MEYKQTTFDEYRDGICLLRRKVFIEEQKCPDEMEWSEEEEQNSVYFLCLNENEVVACVRIRHVGPDLLKLERVAVSKSYRRRGIAKTLIRNAQVYCQHEYPNSSICAYAQVTAMPLYVGLGFSVISHVWLEDGSFIPHQTIFYSNQQAIEVFLQNEKDRPHESYEDFSVHNPKLIEKIEKLKEKYEVFEDYNLNSLHVFLDQNFLSSITVFDFIEFCNSVDGFIRNENPNIEEILKMSDFLTSLADKKLNTGHFSEVNENWRVFYALLAFVKCYAAYKCENYEEAVSIADNGLCMGRICENYVPLRRLAFFVHANLEKPQSSVINSLFTQMQEGPMMSALPKSENISEIIDNETTFETLLSAITTEKPVIIRNFARNMPAFSKWSFEYLLEELHSRTFPVEIGSKYSDEDWSQKMMRFEDFLKNPQDKYLAQHRILDQVPHLKEDITIPDICFSDSENVEDVDMNIWIGPSGTVSPLHTDPRKNIFVQISGSKQFRMVSPEDSECVYPFEGMLSNTSQVDVEHPNIEKFPKFSQICVFDGTVNAGDALYIPRGWWHYGKMGNDHSSSNVDVRTRRSLDASMFNKTKHPCSAPRASVTIPPSSPNTHRLSTDYSHNSPRRSLSEQMGNNVPSRRMSRATIHLENNINDNLSFVEAVRLSPHQVQLLTSTWPRIKSANGGLFIQLFKLLTTRSTICREMFQKMSIVGGFSSNSVCDLNSHAKLLSELLDSLMTDIHQPAKLVQAKCQDIGATHVNMNEKQVAMVFDVLGECFTELITKVECVRSKREASKGWICVVSYIVDSIKSGYQDEYNKRKRNNVAHPSMHDTCPYATKRS